MANQVKENGYYRYFVKRHGQYYIDYIDDIIPVKKEKKKIKPLWGLDIRFPWQLILLKAWLKEKKTW